MNENEDELEKLRLWFKIPCLVTKVQVDVHVSLYRKFRFEMTLKRIIRLKEKTVVQLSNIFFSIILSRFKCINAPNIKRKIFLLTFFSALLLLSGMFCHLITVFLISEIIMNSVTKLDYQS